MAIDNIVMSDKNTGNKIYPVTSLKNLVDAQDLLTTEDVNITPSSSQIPVLGQNVNNVSNFSSRISKLQDFWAYYFTGTFNVKKDMFLDSANSFDTPRRVLFNVPDGFNPNQLQLQTFIGRQRGVPETRNFLFRYLHGNIHWDGFEYTTGFDPNNLPDSFDLEIMGILYSNI